MELLIPFFISVVWFFAGAEVEYQVTKHPDCPEYRLDTNRQMREECRIMKDIADYEEKYGDEFETETK